MASYDVIEIEPAPNEFFDHDVSAPSQPQALPSTETLLAVVYLERATLYEQQLIDGYRRIRWGGMALPQSHPATTMHLRDQELTVVYDSTLDQQLLQIYVYYGWSGIEAAQQSLLDASKAPTTGPLHPWSVVQGFFAFTRNALAVRIQEALVDIETACADHVIGQLNAAATAVDNDWARLDFHPTDISPDGTRKTRLGPSLDTPSKEYLKYWEAGNRKLAGELYAKVRLAVSDQKELRDLQAEHVRLRSELQLHPGGTPPIGGRPGSGATHQPPNRALLDQLSAAQQTLGEKETALEGRYRAVGEELRMGPLAVPMLTPKSNQREMEDVLGRALSKLREELDRITKRITVGSSRSRELFGTWDSSQPLESYAQNESSAETRFVSSALSSAKQDPAFLPMLSEAALDAVLESGRVERDSLAYAVWTHYKLELIRRLAEERRKDELIDQIVSLVNRVASLLSLASFVYPAARGARVISTLLGIGLLMFQVYSVVHTLQMLDQKIAVAMIELEAENAIYVGRLSELMSMPGQYLANVTSTLAVELAWIIKAGAFDLFKELLHLRNYYQDLMALVEG